MIDTPTAGEPTSSPTVVAVVVAYNRLDLLTETLRALAAQTRMPDRVVVVDNASTDGTSGHVAENFPAVVLHTLDRNTGGAGGFAVGIERAVNTLAADLVWLMDDDTVPDPDALAELLAARRHAPERTVLLASAVRWTDGRAHPMNTPRVRPFASKAAVAAASAHDCYPVRTASFVSSLIEVGAIRRHGLPVADYFLWNDDFEYSARLLRHGRGYLCLRSTVEHRTRTFGSTDVDPGARFFWEVRNKIWTITRSAALSLPERPLYAVATVRAWTRTIVRSRDRATLWRGLLTGVRAGVRGPRRNSAVLSGFGGVTEGVAELDQAANERGGRPA